MYPIANQLSARTRLRLLGAASASLIGAGGLRAGTENIRATSPKKISTGG